MTALAIEFFQPKTASSFSPRFAPRVNIWSLCDWSARNFCFLGPGTIFFLLRRAALIITFAFRNVVFVAETNPTNARQLIAYRTIRSFYEQMCSDFADRSVTPVSEQTFYRIMSKEFPEISFVKVFFPSLWSVFPMVLLIIVLFCILCCFASVQYSARNDSPWSNPCNGGRLPLFAIVGNVLGRKWRDLTTPMPGFASGLGGLTKSNDEHCVTSLGGPLIPPVPEFRSGVPRLFLSKKSMRCL